MSGVDDIDAGALNNQRLKINVGWVSDPPLNGSVRTLQRLALSVFLTVVTTFQGGLAVCEDRGVESIAKPALRSPFCRAKCSASTSWYSHASWSFNVLIDCTCIVDFLLIFPLTAPGRPSCTLLVLYGGLENPSEKPSSLRQIEPNHMRRQLRNGLGEFRPISDRSG